VKWAPVDSPAAVQNKGTDMAGWPVMSAIGEAQEAERYRPLGRTSATSVESLKAMRFVGWPVSRISFVTKAKQWQTSEALDAGSSPA
jgi:hypothetical protein